MGLEWVFSYHYNIINLEFGVLNLEEQKIDTVALESPMRRKAKLVSERTIKEIRRITILVVGSTIVLIGVLLLILPGPGLVTIFAGLTLLASEFYWAKKWLIKVQNKIDYITEKSGKFKKK